MTANIGKIFLKCDKSSKEKHKIIWKIYDFIPL